PEAVLCETVSRTAADGCCGIDGTDSCGDDEMTSVGPPADFDAGGPREIGGCDIEARDLALFEFDFAFGGFADGVADAGFKLGGVVQDEDCHAAGTVLRWRDTDGQ